jgi:DUF4097 and DUF4098 domain-containing protein YvlB
MMSKTTKIWLIAAVLAIMIGIIIFVGAMTMLRWDFTKLSTNNYITKNYEITEDFSSVSVITDTSDVTFVASENNKCTVECREQTNMPHSVAVKDGTLVIEATDSRKWYEYIGINFGSPKITVYLPEGEYGALSVKSDTGAVEIPDDFKFKSIDVSVSTGNVKCYASAAEAIKIAATTGKISVENISAGTLELSVSTGNVNVSGVTCKGDVKVGVSTGKTYLTDVVCQSAISSGSTGDILLKNVIAAEKFSIKRSTGDVKFNGCDASEIYVKTDTGDVSGTLLSDKVFITETDTGSINVPNSITGGRCEITTDTGDIKIDVIS